MTTEDNKRPENPNFSADKNDWNESGKPQTDSNPEINAAETSDRDATAKPYLTADNTGEQAKIPQAVAMPIIQPESEAASEDINDTPESKKITPITKPRRKAKKKDETKDILYDEFLTPSKSIAQKRKIKLQPELKLTKALSTKLANTKVLVIDVDGVLTDGSIYITDQGTGFKCFHSQDGHGLKMLLSNGIDLVLLSARRCKATRKRAKELGIENINTGIEDKKAFVLEYMQSNNIMPEEMAYIGDDLVDFAAMMECGTKIMPANGVVCMKKAMDYTTNAHGGHGAVREVCDMILIAKDLYQQYLNY